MRMPAEYRENYRNMIRARRHFGMLSFNPPKLDAACYGIGDWEAEQIRKYEDAQLRKEKG